jgi:heat shock protein HslJ
MSTKMACATGMDLEQRYLQMITATRGYTVTDSGLALRGDSAVHARFVAR